MQAKMVQGITYVLQMLGLLPLARLTNKRGSGPGATVEIVKFGTGEYVGRLIYRKYTQGPPWMGWDFDDMNSRDKFGPAIFDEAIERVREYCPGG